MAQTWTRAQLLGSTSLLVAAVTSLTFATPAFAADTAASKADAGVVSEIVVTGSRIPQAGFDTLQPAQTVSSATLADRGFVNAGDALNELSAFGSAGSNNTGQQTGANVG